METVAAAVLVLLAASGGVCNAREHDSVHNGVEIKSWSVGAQRFVLCSYYEYPVKVVGPHKWLVSELFAVAASRAGSRFLVDVPSDTEAWFTATPPNFVFTILTTRTEAEQRVPLLRHEIALTSGGVTHRTFFVLVGKKFTEKRFSQHLRMFQDPKTTAEQREHLIYLMRDEGVSRPAEALRLLAALNDSEYVDGHIGEELSKIIDELELARDFPHRQPN